jgi:hypothetical protein
MVVQFKVKLDKQRDVMYNLDSILMIFEMKKFFTYRKVASFLDAHIIQNSLDISIDLFCCYNQTMDF